MSPHMVGGIVKRSLAMVFLRPGQAIAKAFGLDDATRLALSIHLFRGLCDCPGCCVLAAVCGGAIDPNSHPLLDRGQARGLILPAVRGCACADIIYAKGFFSFFALIWGAGVHIYTKADADISTPVKSDRFDA